MDTTGAAGRALTVNAPLVGLSTVGELPEDLETRTVYDPVGRPAGIIPETNPFPPFVDAVPIEVLVPSGLFRYNVTLPELDSVLE